VTHALGCYYAPEHGFQVDRDYIAALQPPVIRILDPDVQHIVDMHALAPNAIIAPRTWAIDDGSDEDHPSKQVNRFMADPVGTGRDHAEQYKGQWDRWQQEAAQRGLKLPPVERILFNSANEPNQGGTPDKIAVYCVAFFDRCTELGIRACGPCLGVGWPDNNGPDTPVDWSPYVDAGLEQAIQRNGGMLSVHEYFYKSGPQDNWRWLAGRHLQCPFDVPILLGEIGIDNYVDAPRWGKEGGNRGWQGNVSPEQYAGMIQYHINHSDSRVVAALPFITDFRNNSWESFNTRAAHGALLARKDNMVTQGKPVTVHLPSVSAPEPVYPPFDPFSDENWFSKAKRGYIVFDNVNVRNGPGLDYDVVDTMQQGEPVEVDVEVDRTGYNWVRVANDGWVADKFVKWEGVQPVSTRDNWTRAYPEVLKIEGDLSLDPNDPGNYYRGQLIGTKYGISAAVWGGQYDIPNLTEAQALEIYKAHYWDAAGCNDLAWPMCLIHFDTAIQHGVGVANALLHYEPTPEEQYLGQRALRYMDDPNWRLYGEAWGVRVDNLQDIAKGSD